MELPQFLGMENRPILQNSSIFFGYYEFQLQLSQGPGAKNPNGCTYAIGALKTALSASDQSTFVSNAQGQGMTRVTGASTSGVMHTPSSTVTAAPVGDSGTSTTASNSTNATNSAATVDTDPSITGMVIGLSLMACVCCMICAWFVLLQKKSEGAIKWLKNDDDEETHNDEDSVTIITDVRNTTTHSMVTFVYRKKVFKAKWKALPATQLPAGAVFQLKDVEKAIGGLVVLKGENGSFFNPDERYGKDTVSNEPFPAPPQPEFTLTVDEGCYDVDI